MARALRPLDNTNLSIPYANVLIGEVGGNVFQNAGDVEAFSMSIEVEEVERFGKNFSTKTLRDVAVTQVNATITFEVKDFTKFMRAFSVAADTSSKYTQTAVTGATLSVSALPGQVVSLGKTNVTGVSVEGVTAMGDVVVLTAGTDYVVLEESGYVQILSVGAAVGNLEITFSAPEVLASADVIKAGVASNLDIRKQIHVIGISRKGPRDLLVLHDVQIRPDGEKSLVGEDDFASINITGRVFVDPSKEEGFQLGYLQTIDS